MSPAADSAQGTDDLASTVPSGRAGRPREGRSGLDRTQARRVSPAKPARSLRPQQGFPPMLNPNDTGKTNQNRASGPKRRLKPSPKKRCYPGHPD